MRKEHQAELKLRVAAAREARTRKRVAEIEAERRQKKEEVEEKKRRQEEEERSKKEQLERWVELTLYSWGCTQS